MKNTQIISIVEQAVMERMQAKTSFTALDISNALKSQRYPVKHRDVAPIVRDIYAGGAMDFYDYHRRLIDVVTDSGTKQAQAFLYLHGGARDREYTTRSQTALPPVTAAQARALSGCGAAGPVPILPRPARPQGRRNSRRRQRRDGALAVPRALILRLGWTVGVTLALDAEPGTLKLRPSPDGGPVRVWDDLRLRLCQRKLRLGSLTAGSATFEIDDNSLKIAVQEKNDVE